MSSPTFTGTQVNYYAVCKRKLWLFSHDIEMERENVQIGKNLWIKKENRLHDTHH